MKALKTLFVFAAGAAAGYFIATNRVELNINIEPVIEKIKEKLGIEVIDCDCDCCCDEDEEKYEEPHYEPGN